MLTSERATFTGSTLCLARAAGRVAHCVFAIATLCGTLHGSDELYKPRFEKLNDEQRQLLRDCVAGQVALTELYASYRAAGQRTVITDKGSTNAQQFEYKQRSDGYVLNRIVPNLADGVPVPCGTLIRPEGFVRVSSTGVDGRGRVSEFGQNTERGLLLLSSERFRSAPTLIQVWPVHTWLTEPRLSSGLPLDNKYEALELTTGTTESSSRNLVTLQLAMPTTLPELRRISVDFLKDHLWAVSRVERVSVEPSGASDGGFLTGRELTEVDYDFSKPGQPRMKRFKYSLAIAPTASEVEIDWSTVPVRSLQDYRFDTLEFVTPDLKEFEPSALGLSNITATPAKPDAWLWRLGLCVGGVVLVALAFLIRRRAIK